MPINAEWSGRLVPSSRSLRLAKNLARPLPDRMYLHLRYLLRFKKLGNFRNPVTYNEKLQWLKLNYRVPGEWRLVDKYQVKSIVSSQVGDDYVIPTLGVWESADDIDFDVLPNAFVLKCTHDSGGVVIVSDKSQVDLEATRARVRTLLRSDFFVSSREHHYRDVPPRVIAEPLIEDTVSGQLIDYKFFCFDGQVRALFVATDRQSGNTKFDYFDADFNPLHIRQYYPNAAVLPDKPSQFDEMIRLSQTLSAGHPHVRVDLYEANGRVYFGELTFYHFGGMKPFVPEKWDRIFGDWFTLPEPLPRERKAKARGRRREAPQ